VSAGLKLRVWFGERDRAGRITSAEAIAREITAAGIGTAVLVRAAEGFGSRGEVQSERMLSLSEDLPLVWSATDAPERITPLADRIANLIPQGLVTLERCTIAPGGSAPELPDADQIKVTLTLGRGRRSGGTLATHRAVDLLQAAGAAATWLTLGVDGMLHGVRHRARLIGTNASVPAKVMAIGDRAAIDAGVRSLQGAGIAFALVTLERVRIVKRDGAPIAPVEDPGAGGDPSGTWQMLTLITREDAGGGDTAPHIAMLRAARDHGMRGGTALPAVWGTAGSGPPHGDSMRRLRRGIPIACVVIDTPEAIARFWPAVDALSNDVGVVFSERVPAFRTHGPAGTHGRLGFDGGA
jgi:PII-like signaling protein